MKTPKLYLKLILILLTVSNTCWSQDLILDGIVKGVNNEKLAYVNMVFKEMC